MLNNFRDCGAKVFYSKHLGRNKNGDDVYMLMTSLGPVPHVIPAESYKIKFDFSILPYEDECDCVCHDNTGMNWVHQEPCCKPRPSGYTIKYTFTEEQKLNRDLYNLINKISL